MGYDETGSHAFNVDYKVGKMIAIVEIEGDMDT